MLILNRGSSINDITVKIDRHVFSLEISQKSYSALQISEPTPLLKPWHHLWMTSKIELLLIFPKKIPSKFQTPISIDSITNRCRMVSGFARKTRINFEIKEILKIKSYICFFVPWIFMWKEWIITFDKDYMGKWDFNLGEQWNRGHWGGVFFISELLVTEASM
jgi:hypothetical protein